MVPCGPDMGCHVVPLCGVQFWLDSVGVEPTTFKASGNVLVQAGLQSNLPYVS
jgi:hypothetical protein